MNQKMTPLIHLHPSAFILLRQRLGESPVHDLDLAKRAHHDVGRLQVPVDYAAAVSVSNRLTHLAEDAQ
jgi:hypothetical protein